MKADRPKTPATNPGPAEHESSREAPAPTGSDECAEGGAAIPEVLQLLKQLRELKEYCFYYVSAKTDSLRLRGRNTLLGMALCALALMTLTGVLITASWFVLSGVAGGLGVLFGDRLWLGNIATGVLASAALGFGLYYAVAQGMSTSRKRTVEKYEERQARQRTTYGYSIHDKAADAASPNK